jgi:uncharacterized protein YbjT (DUF2867 family)
MKIVVVGGSGVIGSRLVTLLARDGHEVVAASRRSGVDPRRVVADETAACREPVSTGANDIHFHQTLRRTARVNLVVGF